MPTLVDPADQETVEKLGVGKSEEIVTKLNRILDEGDGRMWAMRRMAFEAVLYTVGEHNLRFHPALRRWVSAATQKKSTDYVDRPEINLILGPVEIAYAQLFRSDPVGIVVANSTDEQDRQGARVADKIRQFKDWEDRMGAKRRRAGMQMIITGNAFAFSYLEADYVHTISVPKIRTEMAYLNPNGEPIYDDQLQGYLAAGGQFGSPDRQPVQRTYTNPATGQPQTEDIPLTDAQTDILSMFEVVLDFYAESFDDCRWFAYKRVKPVDWIGDTFGTAAMEKVKANAKNLSAMSLNWRFQEILARGMDAGYGMEMSQKYRIENACVVKTFVHKPTASQPKGRVVIAAGDQVLYSSANPWYLTEDRQQLGLVHLGYSPIVGTPWHFGIVKNIIDPNKRVRSLHAGLMHTRRTMGFPQWLLPRGSGMVTDQMTGKPGLVLTWDPARTKGVSPQRLPGMEPSQASILEIEHCTNLIEKISGTNEVLEGRQPFGGMPGISLSLLAEKAGARFTYQKQNLEDGLSMMDCQRLQLIQLSRRWQMPQIVRLVGKAGDVEAGSFAAADMRGNTDVRYEITTKQASSQAAYQQTLLDLTKIVSPDGRALIDLSNPSNRMLLREEFGASRFLDQESADYRRASWENSQMERGIQPQILPFENSEIHFGVHLEDIKDPSHESLPDEIKQLKMAHLFETAMKIQAVEMKAAGTAVGDPSGEVPAGDAGIQGPQPGSNGSASVAAHGGSGAPMPPPA